MPDAPEADYSVHLKRLGLDPQTLKLDTRGGLAAPAAREQADALPRVTVSASSSEPSDLTVLKTLGTGGMGEVMLATQRALGREVALKRLNPHAPQDATGELLREALVTGRLEHPNIVPVHMLAVSQEGEPFFVMKRIEGIPWRKLLRDPAALAAVGRETQDPLAMHLDVFLAVCDAVAFAHSRGVLHRDLKPDNVMVGAFGEVYVLDWGIAVGLTREAGLPLAADVTTVTGTPAYMAPEMAAGDGKALGVHSDVFLLGAMLYEVLVGRPPHVGDSPLNTLELAWRWSGPPETAALPEGLRPVVRRAMAAAPAERFPSVEALRAAVVEFLRHKDAVTLAAEAKARAAALATLLASSSPPDDVAVHTAFSEARFGYSQALRIWPKYEAALAGRDEVTVLMARHELKGERIAAARALLGQLAVRDPKLEADIAAVEAKLAERQTRLDSLERDIDLDRAVTTRGILSIVQGVVLGLFGIVLGELHRRGLFTFAHRETLIGLALFSFVHLAIIDRRLRPILNLAGRRALNANMVGMAGMVAFWIGAWHVGVPFPSAVLLFMVALTMGWGVFAVALDWRASVVAITYGVGALVLLAFPAGVYEIFGGATALAFAALGYAWRHLKSVRAP